MVMNAELQGEIGFQNCGRSGVIPARLGTVNTEQTGQQSQAEGEGMGEETSKILNLVAPTESHKNSSRVHILFQLSTY